MDVYAPSGSGLTMRLPAVILVHGRPIPSQARPKDWAVFVSYGELLAASGLIAVTFNHRFSDGSQLEAASDVAVASRPSKSCRRPWASTPSASRFGRSRGAGPS
jgi:hypothetical protein